MIRPVVLAVLALFLTVGQASAECAWVVWSYGVVAGEEIYSIEAAHPSRTECETDLIVFARVLKQDGYTVTSGGRVVIGRKGAESTKYLCLPDTMDPRGPKGIR